MALCAFVPVKLPAVRERFSLANDDIFIIRRQYSRKVALFDRFKKAADDLNIFL